MPTDTERRLEQLENLLLFGGGVAAGTASGRQLGGAALRLGGRAAMANPYAVAALLAYEGYIHRDQIADIASGLAQQLGQGSQLQQETTRPVGALGLGPQFVKAKKRATSKANKAVKQGMTWLKAGTKAATGAVPGTMPAKGFVTAVKAAGMANPSTKSKPGKGKSILNKLARRLKKWW